MGAMKNTIGSTIHKTVKPSVIASQAASAIVASGNAMNSIKINATIPKSEALPDPMAALAKAGSKR
ncbi:hypothetical protein [Mobiluncus curtisii]|uniref:hypothetical protein n=1 Tax=Mobiluncus curtisii TaxID=2051 RepID=UPI0014703A15|nr:hypothetical protein [Mobiluncus curtisii]NMW89497.1 hypothetical protein [Mobiluncus curtisii]